MLQSQVTIIPDDTGRPSLWFVLESNHASLEALAADLRETGLVYGDRIDTVKLAQGRRQETRRYPYVLGKAALASIEPVRFTLLAPGHSHG